MRKNINCFEANHTVKVLQFNRFIYLNNSTEKKKIALVDKHAQLDEVVELLRERMQDFPQHRFNIDHTQSVWEQMVENLEEGMIIKVQDFSENYT